MQKHITIGLFRAFETSSLAMAENHDLLEQYDLTKKNINYVKNEGFKLNTMAIAFKFVINYDTLGVMDFFLVEMFWIYIFRAYQYVVAKKNL